MDGNRNKYLWEYCKSAEWNWIYTKKIQMKTKHQQK